MIPKVTETLHNQSTNSSINNEEKDQDFKDCLLKQIMTSDDFKRIENFVYDMIADESRKKLWSYITIKPNDSDTYTDSFGIEVDGKVVIPKELVVPRAYSRSFYPLTDDGNMFRTERPYDYLCTFSVRSFFDSYDDANVIDKGVHQMLRMQSQSRFTNIWRQLAAVLYALDSKLCTYHHIVRRYTHALLGSYTEQPFYESREVITFNDYNCVSILPSLMYTLMSVGVDIMCGMINEGDAKIILDNYLYNAKDSFCDTKLKLKDGYRNWLNEALHNLKSDLVIKWSRDCEILYLFQKDTTEHEEILKFIMNAKEKRKELLSAEMFNYIEQRMKLIKTIDDVQTLFKTTRSMSNDRGYYKTLVELSLDAAVAPRLRHRVLPAPAPRLLDSEGKLLDFTFEGVDERMFKCEAYMRDAAVTVMTKVTNLDLHKGWLHYITTASAGKKLRTEELEKLPTIVQKVSNIRIVRVAIEAAEYYDVITMMKSIQDSTILVVRQQIDRRQRTIAGLSNQKLYTSFPSYRIGKEYYDLSPSVAQGKQLGNMLDIGDLLYITTRESALCSSVDISGMDASIQTSLRRIFDTLTLNVSKGMTKTIYIPWYNKVETVTEISQDQKEITKYLAEIPGVTRALAFQAGTLQTSTVYNSTLFGQINNREGTYPSGQADTSTHHTVLLDAVLSASGREYREKMKPFTRTMNREMGDDVLAGYEGDMDDNVQNAKFDAEYIADMGFKTTLDFSRNQGIFLQQQVVNGRYFGLFDRVSFFTREHVKAIKSLSSACAELNSLVDDMNSRVADHYGLQTLQRAIGLFCLSRFTLELDTKKYEKIRDRLKKHIRVQEYTAAINRATKLLSIYMPFAWFFMTNGGEFTNPGLYRDDGSLIPQEYITAPGGAYKRRAMMDLVGFDKFRFKDGFIYSNSLKEYGFIKGQYIIDINFEDLLSQSRLSEEDELEINSLATTLDSTGDTTKLDKSFIAYDRLLKAGITVEKSLVLAYNTQTKIKQVILSGEVDNHNTQKFSELLEVRLLELTGRKDNAGIIYKLKADDVYHMYKVNFEEDSMLGLSDESHLTAKCPFLYSMKFPNEMWLLHALLGGPSGRYSQLKRELASIRGKYAQFKYSDPAFKKAFQIYLNDRHLLDDYFTAIGVENKSKQTYVSALAYYNQFGNYQYDFIINPRRIFALNDNMNVVEKSLLIENIADGVNNSTAAIKAGVNVNLFRSLINTYAYTFALSHVKEILTRGRKISIVISNDLLSRLLKNSLKSKTQ